MRLVLLMTLFALSGGAQPVSACAGAVPVDLVFAAQSAVLDAPEQSKLEAAVQRAKAGATYGLKVAFAVYSGATEANGRIDADKLNQRRVEALRSSLLALGFEASTVVAVRGAPESLPRPLNNGGLAEVEIAFACRGS